MSISNVKHRGAGQTGTAGTVDVEGLISAVNKGDASTLLALSAQRMGELAAIDLKTGNPASRERASVVQRMLANNLLPGGLNAPPICVATGEPVSETEKTGQGWVPA